MMDGFCPVLQRRRTFSHLFAWPLQWRGQARRAKRKPSSHVKIQGTRKWPPPDSYRRQYEKGTRDPLAAILQALTAGSSPFIAGSIARSQGGLEELLRAGGSVAWCQQWTNGTYLGGGVAGGWCTTGTINWLHNWPPLCHFIQCHDRQTWALSLAEYQISGMIDRAISRHHFLSFVGEYTGHSLVRSTAHWPKWSLHVHPAHSRHRTLGCIFLLYVMYRIIMEFWQLALFRGPDRQ